MYFSTFHSYFNEEYTDITKKEETLCIICWESKGVIEDLQIIVKQTHVCRYVGKFHHECLYTWFNKNQYCPMCRGKVDVLPIMNNDKNTRIHTFLTNSINVLLFCLKYYNYTVYILSFYFILSIISLSKSN